MHAPRRGAGVSAPAGQQVLLVREPGPFLFQHCSLELLILQLPVAGPWRLWRVVCQPRKLHSCVRGHQVLVNSAGWVGQGVGSLSHELCGAVPSHVDISLPCQSAVLPVVAQQHRAQVAAVLVRSVCFCSGAPVSLCVGGVEPRQSTMHALCLLWVSSGWLDGA